MKQKLTELKGETDKYTITVEGVNIPQYLIENIGRPSVKNIDLNNTANLF